ncbi:MAG: hypothetical protein ACOX6M_01060 [Armatimonadota bacterium]|nr:hypothetical protein [Acidobacteriota bacterium]
MSNWADDNPGCSGRARVYLAMGLADLVLLTEAEISRAPRATAP